MSAIFHNQKQVSNERDWPGRANVVLYLSDTPVISVQQGTTFGLTKMLHESMGGNGQVIGLRKRQRSLPLACIITQDETVLIEGEYDIILNEKPRNVFPDLKLSIYPNKNARDSGISLQNEDQFWRQELFPTARHMTWMNDMGDNGDQLQRRARDCHPWNGNDDAQDDNDSNSAGTHNDYAQKQQTKTGTHKSQQRRTRKDSIIEYQESDRAAAVSPINSCSSPNTDSTNESCESLLKEVEQSTPPKRKWQCSHCKKFFRCRSAHNSHKRTHTGEKPFKCDVCGRCFSHNGNLKQHMYIHRKVRPHVCDVCGQGFIRPNRLREHKLSHEYKYYMLTKIKLTNKQNITAANHV